MITETRGAKWAVERSQRRALGRASGSPCALAILDGSRFSSHALLDVTGMLADRGDCSRAEAAGTRARRPSLGAATFRKFIWTLSQVATELAFNKLTKEVAVQPPDTNVGVEHDPRADVRVGSPRERGLPTSGW